MRHATQPSHRSDALCQLCLLYHNTVRRQVILAYELSADGSCPELARNAEGEHLDPFDPGVYVPGVTSAFKRFFPP